MPTNRTPIRSDDLWMILLIDELLARLSGQKNDPVWLKSEKSGSSRHRHNHPSGFRGSKTRMSPLRGQQSPPPHLLHEGAPAVAIIVKSAQVEAGGPVEEFQV